ncbi:hypothetical protein, partial [Pseudomonas aeruginosa]
GRELVDGCAGEYGNSGDGGEFWQAWAAVVITLASHNDDGITLAKPPKGRVQRLDNAQPRRWIYT